MKITRKLDSLNRIVLPHEVTKLGWDAGTPLDITVGHSLVTISTHRPACKVCGETEGKLLPLHDTYLCENCLTLATQASNEE